MSPAKSSAGPLVLFHGAFGDTILLTPMLQALAHRWGRPCDVVAGGAPAETILRGAGFVGRVVTLGSRRTPYFLSPGQQRIVRWLEARGTGPGWIVERWRHRVSPFSDLTRLEWLLQRSGGERSGWISRLDCPRGLLEYVVEHQLRMAALDPVGWRGLAAAAMPDPPPRTRLGVAEEELGECRAWLRGRGWSGEPLVLLQSGSRRPHLRGAWSAECWTGLARGVLEILPEARVLFTGVPSEREATRALVAAAGDERVAEVAGELPMRRLFALLRLAHSCVSLDTGPAQAAVALECPVVVLSGTGDPRRNLPGDLPERVRIVAAWDPPDWPDDPQIWFDRHRISEIPLRRVLEAWRALAPRGAETDTD